MDDADVRVAQRRGRFRFLQEPLQAFPVRGNVGRQKLQGNGAVQLGVLSQIDLAHPTYTKLLENPVMADCL
jgi:hypothetical protein